MKARISLRIATRVPFAGGIAFGDTGPYERIIGRVRFAVDPADAAYSGVVDIQHAERGRDDFVECTSDVFILKPLDLARGNRRLLYDVNNRGSKRALTYFNDALASNDPATEAHAGNGFLMRRGYTVVWSGWQGDILPGDSRMTFAVPIARDAGRPITGPMRAEFIASAPGVTCLPLSGNAFTRSYESVSLDTASAVLTRRRQETDPRVPVPAGEWRFASVGKDGRPTPSAFHCYLPSGFAPGWIHELVYTAKDPRVMGLGFTAVRDLVSFLLHDEADDDGSPNPLRQGGVAIEMAYAWGRSQSGRYLREFVYRGFNADAQGRRVFAAVSPTVSGGGRVTLNYRFAQPGRYPRQHEDHLYPSDQFPFAYRVTTDHLTGKTDGILKRPETDPLFVHTQTSSEYWERRGSLVHTDTRGTDLPDHERSRVYLFSSMQHSAFPYEGPQEGPHKHLSNPLPTPPLLRALLDAMDAWATDGTPPPTSRVPRRADETGVPADVAAARFPAIPGADCPREPNRAFVQDYGSDFDKGVVSREPCGEDRGREYAVLVSQVDGNGNEVAGIRTPDVEAPLATYTGWNRWPDGTADGAMFSIIGSFLPFASTREKREAARDPRPSVAERYRSKGQYVRAVAAAAQRLVEQRLLLDEDADRFVERAMHADLPA